MGCRCRISVGCAEHDLPNHAPAMLSLLPRGLECNEDRLGLQNAASGYFLVGFVMEKWGLGAGGFWQQSGINASGSLEAQPL